MDVPLAQLRDGFRTKLWPIPTLTVLAAIALGLALPQLDGELDVSGSNLLFGGGADAARTVLSAIAGSLITVTSLTFSLTVVTLQLASSQFSPRLLRMFTRDLVVQATLGLFLGTFVFALTVLRTVRTETGGEPAFIPRVSVTVAFLLATASVIVLVLFLGHLTQTIRVESMLRSVHQGASAVVSSVSGTVGISLDTARRSVPDHARPLLASSSGFVIDIDEERLMRAVLDGDASAYVERRVGDSVVSGTPIGWVWGSTGVPLDADRGDALVSEIDGCVMTGFERTDFFDLSFGLQQLTDVAVKALSPGINDPTTAVHALGHSSALLCEMSQISLATHRVRDGDGETRLVLAGHAFGDLLGLAVEQPAIYGSDDPIVMQRLFMLLREVAWTGGMSVAEPVTDQLGRLRRLLDRTELDPLDRATLDDAAERVSAAVKGRWAP